MIAVANIANGVKSGHRLTLSIDGGMTSFECDSAEMLAVNIAMQLPTFAKKLRICVKTKRWGYVGDPGVPRTFNRKDFDGAWDACMKSYLMWLRQDHMVSGLVCFSTKN